MPDAGTRGRKHREPSDAPRQPLRAAFVVSDEGSDYAWGDAPTGKRGMSCLFLHLPEKRIAPRAGRRQSVPTRPLGPLTRRVSTDKIICLDQSESLARYIL